MTKFLKPAKNFYWSNVFKNGFSCRKVTHLNKTTYCRPIETISIKFYVRFCRSIFFNTLFPGANVIGTRELSSDFVPVRDVIAYNSQFLRIFEEICGCKDCLHVYFD